MIFGLKLCSLYFIVWNTFRNGDFGMLEKWTNMFLLYYFTTIINQIVHRIRIFYVLVFKIQNIL